jgi:hypothetical protein
MSNLKFRKSRRIGNQSDLDHRSQSSKNAPLVRAEHSHLSLEFLEKRVLLSGSGVGDDLFYTITGSGEKSVEELLEGIYGGDFSSDDGIATGTSRTIYLGGGLDGNVAAVRVFDHSNNEADPINLISGTPSDIDQIWTDGVARGTAQAKFAAYSQEFGYDQHDGVNGDRTGYEPWIQVVGNGFASDGMSTQIIGDAERAFSPTWEWVRTGNKPGAPHDLWYSGSNTDGVDHMITYEITGLDNGADKTWLLFWEDEVKWKSDRDFNDLVVEVQANRVAPEFVVTIEATDPVAAEPDNPGTFTLTRSGGSDGDLEVQFSIAGSATNGQDYDAIDSMLVIPDGQTSATITIEPIDDDEPEGLEDIVLTLQSGDMYAVGGTATAAIIIGDDDVSSDQPLVLMFSNDPIAAEPDDNGTFAVYRLGGTSGDLEVNYTIGGSAANGSDYSNIAETITIPDGLDFAEIEVEVVNDAEVEGFEDVVLTLASDPDYDVGFINSATVIIIDDDVEGGLPIVSLIATDAHAAEPSDTGRFTAIRTGDIADELTLHFTIAGTAVNGGDYEAIESSVTIPAGEISANIAINPIDDDAIEGEENITLSLVEDLLYIVGSGNSDTVTLADDDIDDQLPLVSIFTSDSHAAEPNNDGKFTVFRSGDTTTDLVIQLQVSGTGLEGEDFAMVGTSVTINAGALFADILIETIDDLEVEINEDVFVTLKTDPAYNVGVDNQDAVTIKDNDLFIVSVTATEADASEPDGNGRFTISRTGGTLGAVEVFYTISGTAVVGEDFDSLGTSVIIPDGQSSVDLIVSVIDDDQVEAIEDVQMTLTPDITYGIAAANDTVTIADDDDFVVSIASSDDDAGEPANPGEFLVSRSGGTLGSLTVLYSVSGLADNGVDYDELFGTIVLEAGQSSAPISINPVDDDLIEGAEDVLVTLTEDAAYNLGLDSSAGLTLADNDENLVSVFATEDDAREPGDNGLFTISRTGDLRESLTVHYTLGGSATNGVDYEQILESIVIEANQDSATIAVLVINDELGERIEDVVLTVMNDPTYAIGTQDADTVTITDEGLTLAFGDGFARTLSYLDPDGTLGKVQAKKASGHVFFWGDGFEVSEGKRGLMVSGDNVAIGTLGLDVSTDKSMVRIKARGGVDNHLDVDHIEIAGPVKKIMGKRTNLVESLTVEGGLQNLLLADIGESAVLVTNAPNEKGVRIRVNEVKSDATFDLAGKLKRFQALNYNSGELMADEIQNIIIKREIFGANVTAKEGGLRSINSLSDVAGMVIAEDNIDRILSRKGNFTGIARSGRDIGFIKALKFEDALVSAGRDVRKIVVNGDMVDTHILAGYDFGTDGALGGSLPGDQDILSSGDVLSTRVKGEFIRSYIGAGVLPVSPLTSASLPDIGLPQAGLSGTIGKVKFGGVSLDTTVDFGLFAATEIEPFKIGKVLAESIQNFKIDVL